MRHSVTELTPTSSHSPPQWRDGFPLGSGRNSAVDDSQACDGAALLSQSIKCLYPCAGAGAPVREPSSEAEPARGGALSGRTGRPWGPSRCGLCCVRMFWVMLWECLCFVFFADFKQDSPGFLGDPRGCPRQEEASPLAVWTDYLRSRV
jgi:hypothetical protein